ncbi:hypothetical protein T281_12380 [Rhodomicrobium udaipurense JA643]|nr:hypothetical protein T281_12380 [Rhodomicrobium udaipurense JA643]
MKRGLAAFARRAARATGFEREKRGEAAVRQRAHAAPAILMRRRTVRQVLLETRFRQAQGAFQVFRLSMILPQNPQPLLRIMP